MPAGTAASAPRSCRAPRRSATSRIGWRAVGSTRGLSPDARSCSKASSTNGSGQRIAARRAGERHRAARAGDHPGCRLLQVVLELAAAARVPQLAERLCLDLANPLACDVEVTADLFEGPGTSVLEAEAQLKHPPLTRREGIQHALDLLLQELVAGGIGRGDGGKVRDEVAEVAVLLLADRRLEAHRLLGDLHDLAHLLGADGLRTIGHALVDLALGRLSLELVAQLADDLVAAHASRDLLHRRLSAQLLEQGPADPDEAVAGLDHVHRAADRAGLVGI